MTEKSSPTTPFDEFFRLTDTAFKTGFPNGGLGAQQISDLYLKLGSEWLRFVAQRFTAQAELLQRLRACENVEAVVQTEAQFFENAADEYGQEFDRLSEVARGEPAPRRGKRAA